MASMSSVTWRLLVTKAMDGPRNMAIDQAIMEAVTEELIPPTLRFYAWQPPCLSLGYTQPVVDVDRARLAERGWDLVRRLTGGRAILHTDELTYSVTVQAANPIVAGDIVASYRRLSQALLNGLRDLGADPQADKRASEHHETHGPVCFEVPSHYEITVGGKKLIGSAQVRKAGAVLQHGSLPLTGDITRICDALVYTDNDERERVRSRVVLRAATLESVLGQTVSWEQAVAAMTRSFQETFDLEFTSSNALTADELRRAEELRTQQYATEAWNARF